MKKHIASIFVLFVITAPTFSQNYYPDAVQLVFPTNGQTVMDELRISGSIRNDVFERYESITMNVLIGETEMSLYPDIPSFATNIDIGDYNYGELELILSAYGYRTDLETGSKIEEMIDSTFVTVERSLRFKPAGIIFMILTWVGIIGLNIFAFSNIFRKKKR